MRTILTATFMFLLVLFLAATAVFAAGDAVQGKDLYLKKCKACHAEDGAGTPAMQKKFADKLKPLGGPAVQGMSDAALKKSFAEAANHKALAKTTTDADLDNLIAHVRTLKK